MKKYLFVTLSLFSICFADNTRELPQALKTWAEGHHMFKQEFFEANEDEFIRLVKEGQSPKALVVSCSDSRVVPEFITNSKPGDIFVVRNAGNFVPVYNENIAYDGVAASIIYSIDVLGIKEIIVCGHSSCGAIDGLYQIENLKKMPQLVSWLQFGKEAKTIFQTMDHKDLTPQERNGITGRASVVVQLEHLLTYPSIKDKVEKKEIRLHGWYFVISTGALEYWDETSGAFKPFGIAAKQ